MKTTIDLPADLVRAFKLCAIHEHWNLKDMVVEIVCRALGSQEMSASDTLRRVKLPLINCRHAAEPMSELTPEQVAETLLKQEVEWSHEATRH